MAEGAQEGEFRVTDRRRRAEEAEPSAPPVADEAPPGPVEAPGAPTEPAAGRPSARPADSAERGLEGLFLMLASSAVVALGQAADPTTGQVRDPDPGAASDAIDLLALLREKTEGHRTERETRLLTELIYDLQMRYVAATRSAR